MRLGADEQRDEPHEHPGDRCAEQGGDHSGCQTPADGFHLVVTSCFAAAGSHSAPLRTLAAMGSLADAGRGILER